MRFFWRLHINSSPRITNCYFQANIAIGSGAGGAISNKGNSHPSIKESTFSNNRARLGGAVYSSGSYGGTYDKCIFTNNGFDGVEDDLSVEGGAIYFADADYTHRPVVHLLRCQFQNNKAKSGGAVYLNEASFASTSEIRDCIFTDNRAEIQGGAVFQEGGIPIVHCNFIGNCAGFLTVPPFEPGNLENDNKGGAISMTGLAYFSVTNCRFDDNWAFYGGAIFAENYWATYFTNSTFRSNHAYRGGAISVGPQDSYASLWKSTRIMNCFFSFNQAEEDGGALYGDSIRADILHCTFFANSCEYYGGAFRYANSENWWESIYIANSIFWENRSQTPEMYCENEISMHQDAPVYVEYSDIYLYRECDSPFLESEGNISQNPLFTYSVPAVI